MPQWKEKKFKDAEFGAYDEGEHWERFDRVLPKGITIHKVSKEKHYNALPLPNDQEFGIVLRYPPIKNRDDLHPPESRIRQLDEVDELIRKANHEAMFDPVWERAEHMLEMHGFEYDHNDGITGNETVMYWTKKIKEGLSVTYVKYRPEHARGVWEDEIEVQMYRAKDRARLGMSRFDPLQAVAAAQVACAYAEIGEALIEKKQ